MPLTVTTSSPRKQAVHSPPSPRPQTLISLAGVAAMLTLLTVAVELWDNVLHTASVFFLAAVFGISVTLAVMAGGSVQRVQSRGRDVIAAVDAALHIAAGARHWAAVYTAADGEEYEIHAPDQDPLIAAQQLADGVHGLTCGGCERCESPAVAA